MSSGATVLYDAPGPATRRRHRIYSVVFGLVLLAIVFWMYRRLDAHGEFESRVFEGLAKENIWRAIGDGVTATLKVAGMAIVGSVVLGVLLAAGRLSDHVWVRLPFRAFIEFFRAVPVLLMLIFIFSATGGHGLETETRALIALVTGLTLYNGCVLAEVFRAGIQAVPKGQSEAAYAIGLRKTQVMTIVLMPQAVRFMLPAIISQCVVALKDTTLGFIVAYPELASQGRQISLFLDNVLIVYAVIALIYIVLNNVLSEFATWLEKRLSRSSRAVVVEPDPVEEAAAER